MPGTSIGNPSRYSTATAWASGQVRSLGALATPSTANGLVFICTGAGTTAASEPGWNTAPYPTLGTVFTDGGGVQWTTYGTQPGNFSPIAQLPVDGDPPLAFSQVTAEQTILDELAWLVEYGGSWLLSASSTWTGNNTWSGTSLFSGTSTTFTNNAIFNGGAAIYSFLTMHGGISMVTGSLGLYAGNLSRNNGVVTAGSWGANTTLATGTQTNITTGSTLCTYTPSATGLYRIDVYCNSPSSSTPYLNLAWYDPTSGSVEFGEGAVQAMTLVTPPGVSGKYIWSASIILSCSSGAPIVVSISQHASETLATATAAITAIA